MAQMKVSFAPYSFTLVGTDLAGSFVGEVHTVRVHLKAGVWAVRHKERVECYQDFPDAHLGQIQACELAGKILRDEQWYPGKLETEDSLTEICARVGGLVSVARDSIGINGPFALPFADGLEKNGVLLRLEGNATDWVRTSIPAHSVSFTLMAGALVKSMAAGDWEKAGDVLEQSWKLYREQAPDEVVRVYADARMQGAWGGVWCGDNTLFFMAPSEWHDAIANIAGVERLPFKISHQGAGVRAVLRP